MLKLDYFAVHFYLRTVYYIINPIQVHIIYFTVILHNPLHTTNKPRFKRETRQTANKYVKSINFYCFAFFDILFIAHQQ